MKIYLIQSNTWCYLIYKKILDAKLKEKQPIEKSDIYNLVKIFGFKHEICKTSNKISRST